MNATANLFVPEIADKDEIEFPPVLHCDSTQNQICDLAPADFEEAVVEHFESRLNAAAGSVLHLGAGSGELMERLRQHGFTVLGCEPSLYRTRLARKIHGFDARTLHCSSAENFLHWLRRIGQRVQAIFVRHDWEHNLELQALLPKMGEILCTEGRVIAVLPPPETDHPHDAHLSFLNELCVACVSSNTGFEVESIDCDFSNRFMAFVLRKVASTAETKLSD